jgi:phage/plasmid-like protein (TIGR03299 family)
MGRRDAAWHKLGTVIPADEKLTVTDAFKRTGLDFGFDRIPLIVDYNGTPLDTGKYAIVRQQAGDDAPIVTGVVNNSYDFLTNMEIAEKLDPLSEQWQVETVGALRGGSTMFAMLNAGDQTVCGEDVKTGFLVTDARDGKEAMKIAFVTTRVVCANTLAIALNNAIDTTSIRHGLGMGDEMDFWLAMIPAMEQAKAQSLTALEAFGDRKLTKVEAKDIFEIAFPKPVYPRKLASVKSLSEYGLDASTLPASIEVEQQRYQRSVEYAERYQEAAFQNWIKIGKDFPKIKSTAWAALNSVTEIADHGGSSSDKRAAEAAVFGWKADLKARTYKALGDLVTA